MEQKRNRTILSGILLILLLVVTLGATFAYWAGTILAPTPDSESIVVETGVAGDVETFLSVEGYSLSNNYKLVPKNNVTDNSIETDNVDITFIQIKWEGPSSVGAIGKLNATVTSFKVDGVEYVNWASLFTITIPVDFAITSGTQVSNFVVNLEFTNEPADVAQYNEIKDKTITITFEFTVTPN